MKVKFSDKAVSDEEFSSNRRIQTLQRPKKEESEFSAGEIFMAGQFKYNPVVSGIHKLSNYMNSPEEDVPGWSVFDNPDLLGGYPASLGIGVSSPEEWSRVTMEYERDKYLAHVASKSGGAGIASSVAAGAMNPLYLIPYVRVGQQFRYGKAIADATVGETLTEGLYQTADLDTLRTGSESMFNIAAGGLMGGIIGGIMARNRFTPDELAEIEDKIKSELAFVGPRMDESSLSLDPSHTSRVGKLSSIPNVERIRGVIPRAMSKLTPLRTLASPNQTTRQLAALLGEQNVVGTHRAAVETLIKRYDSYMGSALVGLNKEWKRFKARGEETMGYTSFKEEVARALRSGDQHPIPEIQVAAQKIRREILVPIREAAKEVGIYGADEDIAKFADSYYPRVYNFEYIARHLDEFEQDIANEILRQNPKVMPDKALKAAREMASKIRHTYDGVNARSQGEEFTAQALKGRKVALPDHAIERWLISDPEYVLRAWSHNMATQIEMTRMFGDTTLAKHLDEVKDGWDKLIAEASKESPQKAAKLERAKNQDIQDLMALRDRLLNRYKLPDNPTSGMVRAGRAARNLNVLRLLGGMTLSALPDLARPLYHHHLGTYAKALHAMATNPTFRQMSRADANRVGIALETVLNQRLTAITELDYVPSVGQGGFVDAAEHGLERLVIGRGGAGLDFGRISLMSPWNSAMKHLTFIMAQDGLVRNLMKNVVNEGKLAEAGISPEMAKRIKAQLKKYGSDDNGLHLSNLDLWDDFEAQRAVEAALIKEVDATIITPGIMDKPLWMSSEFGKLIGQFKSFAFAATNKQLLSGVNNFSGMFVQGSLVAVALGAMSWSLKRNLAGYDEEISDQDLLMRGIEYSGVVGFGSELINFGTGMANAAGVYKGDGNFRWARQGLGSTLAGPTGGLFMDGLRGMRVFTSEDPNGGDVEALRRFLPYQNLFYTRAAFDAAEQRVKDRLGIYD